MISTATYDYLCNALPLTDRHITEARDSYDEQIALRSVARLLYGTRHRDGAFAYLYQFSDVDTFTNYGWSDFASATAVIAWVRVDTLNMTSPNTHNFLVRNGYEYKEVINLYIRQQFGCDALVYVNTEKQKAIYFFAREINMRAAVSSVFAALPSLTADEPFSETERELLRAYSEGENIDSLVLDVIEERRESQMAFEQEALKKALEEVEGHPITVLRDKIANTNQSIEAKLMSLIELKKKVVDLTNELDRVISSKTLATTYESLMEFLDRAKNIKVRYLGSARGDKKLYVTITNPIANFNQDLYDDYRCNPTHWINTIGEDNIKLLDAVFLTEELKMHLTTSVALYLGDTRSYPAYSRDLGRGKFPSNPHLEYYNCFGMNEEMIADSWTCGDIIGTITAISASMSNINFADGAVFPRFISSFLDVSEAPDFDSLFNYGSCGEYAESKFISAPDGTLMTPKEAIDYLKSKEESDE